MASMLTKLFKVNLDAQRRAEFPDVASIELQSITDATRAYAKVVAVLSGWMLHREVVNAETGERQELLVLAENAITDAVDTLLTEAMVMTTAKAVLIGANRYRLHNPVIVNSEPRYYQVQCEWIDD